MYGIVWSTKRIPVSTVTANDIDLSEVELCLIVLAEIDSTKLSKLLNVFNAVDSCISISLSSQLIERGQQVPTSTADVQHTSSWLELGFEPLHTIGVHVGSRDCRIVLN